VHERALKGVYTIKMKAFMRHGWLRFGLLVVGVLVGGMLLLTQTDFLDAKPAVSTPPENALYRDPTQPIEARVADLLSYMTLEEKIGQMTLVEKNSIQGGDIAVYHIGGMLSGAGAKPTNNTAMGWKEMIDAYQREAAQSRLGVPLLYGADAIHGHAHVPEATVFPHAIGLGAAGDAELVRNVAKATRIGGNWGELELWTKSRPAARYSLGPNIRSLLRRPSARGAAR
jgi:hypothetical protein